MLQTERKIQRQEKILSTLANLTYATRKQLQIIEKLGGDRNARRVLYDMEKDKLIKSIKRDKKIYYISNRGGERIGANPRLKQSRITHTLMRNDLYIKLGMPLNWRKEIPVKKDGVTIIIPDAVFTRNGNNHFVEIDNKQSMRTNYDKIKTYADICKLIYQQNGRHPTLIWYTLSHIRKEKLKESCEQANIKHVIY